jgi:hypothetical protein
MSVRSCRLLVGFVAYADQAACDIGQEVLVRAYTCDINAIAASDCGTRSIFGDARLLGTRQ